MNFKENCKEIFKSKVFSGIVLVVFILIGIGVVFQAGKFVGLRKAEFSRGMGDNYRRIFDAPGSNMMGLSPRDLPGGHGSVGKIIKIELPNIIVEDNGNVEKTIVINNKTTIREFRDEIKPSDLEVGDYIVVLGKPNSSGQIVANLIRTMPDLTPITGTSSNPIRK
ncbi:MAG: hypothetical protein WCC74_00310 [Minisyncoccia bacterium]